MFFAIIINCKTLYLINQNTDVSTLHQVIFNVKTTLHLHYNNEILKIPEKSSAYNF